MPKFAKNSYMSEIQHRKKIVIGVHTSQPLLGFYDPVKEEYSGFDVEMGKIVAHSLGLSDAQIEWKPTATASRIPFLQNGQVDITIAVFAYSPERGKAVGMAGPYFDVRSQLMVQTSKAGQFKNGAADLKGKKECGTPGSVNNEVATKYGASVVTFKDYGQCVDQLLHGTVDGILLPPSNIAGYIAQHKGKLTIVGKPVAGEIENMIGFSHAHPAMCGFLKAAILKARKDGAIQQVYDKTLGTALSAKKAGNAINLSPKLHATCGVV